MAIQSLIHKIITILYESLLSMQHLLAIYKAWSSYFPTDDSKASAEYYAPAAKSSIANAGPPYTPQCSSGPFNKIYSKPGYFYYPPITVKQCDGLSCMYSRKCVPGKTHMFYRWVLVYKCTNYHCYYKGCQYLRFTEHLNCKCVECIQNSDCPATKNWCNKYTGICQKCPVYGPCPVNYRWDWNRCKCFPYIYNPYWLEPADHDGQLPDNEQFELQW